MIIFGGSISPAGYPGRVPTILVPVALPAAGKSTALRAWAAEDPDHRVVIGRDDLRVILGCLPVGIPAQEGAITVMMAAAVEALLRHGWDVGVDSTHIQPGTLDVWVELARRVGARVEILDLTHVTPETCIQRDLARRDAGGRYVGEDVIREMERLYLKGAREAVRLSSPRRRGAKELGENAAPSLLGLRSSAQDDASHPIRRLSDAARCACQLRSVRPAPGLS